MNLSELNPTDFIFDTIYSNDFLKWSVYSEIKLLSFLFNDKYAFPKIEKYLFILSISSSFFECFDLYIYKGNTIVPKS